jgi:uncharacterized protein YukE
MSGAEEDYMKLDLDSLRASSDKLRSTVELFRGIKSQIEDMGNKDCPYWAGNAPRKFRSEFENIRKNLDADIKTFSALNKSLDLSVAEYESAERMTETTVDALKASDVFKQR